MINDYTMNDWTIMKDIYIKPSIETVEIIPEMITAGWDSQYQSGFNPNPGSEGDFAAKDRNAWEEL